jgi:predicted PurR-regulated permease PerM
MPHAAMRENKVISISLIFIVIFIAGVVLKLAMSVLFPLFLAVFLSFIMYPILDFFTRRKVPKTVAMILLLLITFFGLYLLSMIFYSAGKSFAAELPKYGDKIVAGIDSLQQRFIPPADISPIDWSEHIDLGRIGGLLLSSLGPFLSFISKLFLVFFFLMFILAGRGKTKEKIKRALPPERIERVLNIIGNIDTQIQKYLLIKTFVSLITGAFVTAVLLAFGVDFAITFGFFTFILNFIPNIGSIFATLFPVTIALLQFDSIWPAVWIFVLLTLIQQIMGNVIEPRIMGQGLGLSPLVVLFFLFFWGWLWGLPGMILAVPVAAIIKIVCANIPELEPVAILMSKD